MTKRHHIQFPPYDVKHLDQNEAYFYITQNGKKEKIVFHDYDRIYNIPGLYEQLFYDRLKCNSPQKIRQVLEQTINVNKEHFSEIRVLDFGAGNGIMAEELEKVGVARLIGADILPEAKVAAERDRPGIYDDYYVSDFTKLTEEEKTEISSWNLSAITTVAALGFGDIPPKAFKEALNLISEDGWVAFNIKESFLYESDQSGFSQLIRKLIFSEYVTVHHLERYRHRLSIEGKPLYYFAVVCRKKAHLPKDF